MPDSQHSFLNISLPDPTKQRRQIFVAYSYRLYPSKDYRRVYENLEKAFNVKFIFADEKISNLHILQKIVNYVRESKFGIYDISGWNPNVTLELGLALGMNERAFIAIDPGKTTIEEVPSDLRGVDRIQYNSYSSLEEQLERLLSQEMPPIRDPEAESYLPKLQEKIIELVEGSNGINVSSLAKILGTNIDIVKVAIRPLVGVSVLMKGNRRGAKYYPNR
ncbi:MAG: hypothetical protein PHP53_24730 [Prolixibacteraceae bacterium]|nr:hypothetical protein [Prolixibacteraceae bacterium]